MLGHEAQFRAIFDQSTIGVSAVDLTGQFQMANRRFQQIVGRNEEELRCLRMQDITYPDDLAGNLILFNRLAESGEPFTVEKRYVRPDGSLVWVSNHVSPVRNDAGAVESALTLTEDSTDRKGAIENIERQWRLFDTTLSHTPDSTYIFDPEGRIIYANRTLLGRWRKTLDEALGKTLLELNYPVELGTRVLKQIREVVETGEPIRDETQLMSFTLGARHYEYIFVPVFAKDGRVEAVAGSTRDVTDAKEASTALQVANAALENTREQLTGIFESITDAFFALDNNWCFTYLNREAEVLLCRTREYLLGRNIWEEFVPTGDSIFEREYHRAKAEHLPVEFEAYSESLKTWFEIRAFPSQEGLGVYFHDIDERKAAEETRARYAEELARSDAKERLAQKAIRENEERLRIAVETAKLGTWELNLTTGLIECSPRFKANFGFSSDAALTYPMLLETIHPEDRPLMEQAIETALAAHGDYESEYRVVFSDGTIHWVIASGRPLFQEDAMATRMVGVTLDNTNRKRIEEAMQRSNDELSRANQDLEQFAYSASHDLQEPLRTMTIFTQLLASKYQGQLDADSEQYMGYALQSAKRMELLLKDLLAYSQVANSVDKDVVPTGSAAVMDIVLESLRGSIEETGAKITYDALPLLKIQEVHLVQLFQNLLGNAIKYRSEREPVIHVSAEREGSYWRFSIRDNGIGIDSKYKEHIFGIFKRLHTNDRYLGTGIGLAICQKIVERYRGRIWVESKPGQGATFSFTLPGVG